MGPEGGDALLYGASAVFALLTATLAGLPAYRVWGWIALGPYVVAAGVTILVARRRRRGVPASVPAGAPAPAAALAATCAEGARLPDVAADEVVRSAKERQQTQWGPARLWLLLLLLVGSALVPLSVEVALRNEGPATNHVQPEVVVIAQGGRLLGEGKDPYHATVRHGKVESAVPGEPSFESFFPYLPLMAVFGLPSSAHGPLRVTDTRVLFSVVTLLVVGLALLLLRAPRDKKLRVLQFLTVLPTAALPLATGGDDMPVVALLLLAMVLAQRRRPGWSGFVLGIVSSMKFTAWPLAVLALFAARDERGRRAPGRMALGMLVVAGPVVVPFALENVRAFVDNVILFPLGLAGVSSPAASNLPGHLLEVNFPWLHTIVPLSVAIVGGVVLLRHLVRHTPSTPAAVCTLAGWVMLVAIVFAPSTRVGYLLYPIDFFVWGAMFAASDRPAVAAEVGLALAAA